MTDMRNLVVIVDDLSTGRKILGQIVSEVDPDIEVAAFASAEEALELIATHTPDLILTDYKMPMMNGIEFVRRARAINACRDVPIVVVTVVEDRSIRYQALDAGATDFLTRPIDQYECRARCKNLLTLRRQQKIISDRARWLEDQVAIATREIHSRERETLLRLAKAGEYRDEGTGNHVLRISKYCRVLAEALELSPRDCDEIELAAPMHDIGKVGIPDRILLKDGPLTDHEMAVIRKHPQIGYEILKDSPSRFINVGAEIALSHHEHYDGNGYPNRLAGEAIPLSGRIVAVADVFDALTTKRPYKQAWPIEDAVDYIREAAGTHLDPNVVAAFLEQLGSICRIHAELSDEVDYPTLSGNTILNPG